jgi:hypothetical protein
MQNSITNAKKGTVHRPKKRGFSVAKVKNIEGASVGKSGAKRRDFITVLRLKQRQGLRGDLPSCEAAAMLAARGRPRRGFGQNICRSTLPPL